MGNSQTGTNIRHEYASGDVYVGDFKDGQRHGNGIYTAAQGHRYEGAWLNDMRHGVGTQTFVAVVKKSKTESPTKGSSTKGTADDQKLEWAGTYKGEWAQNLKHGKGVFTYRNKDKYEGDWLKGNKHGNGVYTYANGDRYEGEFHENYMHGRGILYVQAEGNRLAGNWWKDELHGEAIVTLANGETYKETYEWGELKSTTAKGDMKSPTQGRHQKQSSNPSMPKTAETQKDSSGETGSKISSQTSTGTPQVSQVSAS